MTVDFKFSIGDKVRMKDPDMRGYESKSGLVVGAKVLEGMVKFYDLFYPLGKGMIEESLLELVPVESEAT